MIIICGRRLTSFRFEDSLVSSQLVILEETGMIKVLNYNCFYQKHVLR